ncbi:MAG: hypothetical protein RLZZ28_85 [Bacteroidota bacterium]|jgi:opacity protein-like surface antigen
MKKLLLAALIVVAAGSSAFALDVNTLNAKVKTNFEARFYGAQNVQWKLQEDFIKASFTYADQPVEAFFTTDGELIGLSRKMDYQKLPLNALQKIKTDYARYQVVEAIEFEREGDKNYYVSLKEGTSVKILEVSLYGSVSVFRGFK